MTVVWQNCASRRCLRSLMDDASINQGDASGRVGTYLVLRQATLLEHAAGLHGLRLGSAGVVGRARRPGEGITLPPAGTRVHGVGLAKACIVVLDESTIALEGM
jgi:hypothetical protein